ncbi:hypothetical protein ScPMuIL_012475 [Solemya velum]
MDDDIDDTGPGDKKKKVGYYILGKTIGAGAFAKVRCGMHLVAREKVAVKVIPKKTLIIREHVRRNVRREAIMLQRLEHPNIIRLYEVMETGNSYYLVLELAHYGQFIHYLAARGKLTEKEGAFYLRQMVSAIDHMHSSNIVHRDLKLENFLLDKQNVIKLIDFGLSNVFHGDTSLTTQCGSPVYTAPEVFSNRKYGPAVDIWSIGVCMYAMLVGTLPFYPHQTNSLTELHALILRGCTIPDDLTDACRDLLANMLCVDESRRIKMADILCHPWLCEDHTEVIERHLPLYRKAPKFPRTEIINYMSRVHDLQENEILFAIAERKMNAPGATYHLLLKRLDAGLKVNGLSAGELKARFSHSAVSKSESRSRNQIAPARDTFSAYRTYMNYWKISKQKSESNLKDGETIHISPRSSVTRETFNFRSSSEQNLDEHSVSPDSHQMFQWQQEAFIARGKQKPTSSRHGSNLERSRSLVTRGEKTPKRLQTSPPNTPPNTADPFPKLDFQVKPTLPLSRQKTIADLRQAKARSKQKPLLDFLHESKDDIWENVQKQRAKIVKGPTLLRSDTVTFGSRISSRKTLTPRSQESGEVRSFIEEMKLAKVIGRAESFFDRSTKFFKQGTEPLTRKPKTAEERSFPKVDNREMPSKSRLFSDISSHHQLPQFPDKDRSENRVPSPVDRNVVIDGVMPVIKVSITSMNRQRQTSH